MIYTTKKPCAECPFVLGRTKGFIGDYESGDDLHRLAASDVKFPCHKTMGADAEVHCRGIQLYRKVICKKLHDKDADKNMTDVVQALSDSEKAVPPFQLSTYHSTAEVV